MTENRKMLETASDLLSNGRRGPASRAAGYALGRVIDKEGGRVTGRVVAAIVVVLAVVGLAFVAYRLLVLDLILTILRDRD